MEECGFPHAIYIPDKSQVDDVLSCDIREFIKRVEELVNKMTTVYVDFFERHYDEIQNIVKLSNQSNRNNERLEELKTDLMRKVSNLGTPNNGDTSFYDEIVEDVHEYITKRYGRDVFYSVWNHE